MTVAYVKGCLDSGLLGGGRRTRPTPEHDPADPILRAEAEAADALALAQLETAATTVGARPIADAIEPTFLCEWATAPGSPPPGSSSESAVTEAPGLSEWIAEIAATLAPGPAAEPEALMEPELLAEATVESELAPSPRPQSSPRPPRARGRTRARGHRRARGRTGAGAGTRSSTRSEAEAEAEAQAEVEAQGEG